MHSSEADAIAIALLAIPGVRPPQLTNRLSHPAYRLQADQNLDNDQPLARASLAAVLLSEVKQPRFSRRVVAISG
jgi:hypothetical protein